MDDRQSPEWSKLAGLSSWVVWIAGAMGTLQYRKRICRSEAGRRASVLSNRIGLESQEWRFSAESRFGAKSLGACWLVFGGGNIIGGLC